MQVRNVIAIWGRRVVPISSSARNRSRPAAKWRFPSSCWKLVWTRHRSTPSARISEVQFATTIPLRLQLLFIRFYAGSVFTLNAGQVPALERMLSRRVFVFLVFTATFNIATSVRSILRLFFGYASVSDFNLCRQENCPRIGSGIFMPTQFIIFCIHTILFYRLHSWPVCFLPQFLFRFALI